MKKVLKIVFVFTLVFTLISCGKTKDKNKGNDLPNQTYTVTWKNWDGTVLEIDTNVVQGTMPEYNGSTPLRVEDDNYTYTFKGWNPALNTVSSDITYTAEFDAHEKGTIVNQYTVTWKNYDGSLITIDQVNEGEMPVFDTELNGVPTKPEDENNTYSWSGWNPTVVAATQNAVYVATFTAIPKINGDQPDYLVDKKLVVESIEVAADVENHITNLIKNRYQAATASLFIDTSFELYVSYDGIAKYILGNYSLNSEGTSATLTFKKGYNSDSGYYYDIFDSLKTLVINYDETNEKYKLNYAFIYSEEEEIKIANFTLTLVDSKQFPMHANIPDDPNGDNFNPLYQVEQGYWDSIFSGEYDFILRNFKASGNHQYSGAYTIEIDNGKILITRNFIQYYNLKSNVEGGYKFDYYSFQNSSWNVNEVELPYDFFNYDLGIIPAPFLKSTYIDSGNYYYINTFKYADLSNVEHNINNFKVYFNDGYLSKIEYTEYGYNEIVQFSNYNETVVTLPTNVGPIDVTTYYSDLENTLFAYDSISGSNFSNYEIEHADDIYQNATFSLFSNKKCEFYVEHVYDGSEILDNTLTLIGTFSLRLGSYNDNNDDPYIVGDFNIVGSLINGTQYNEIEDSMPFRYFVNSNKIRLQLESGQYIYLNITTLTPTPTEIPNDPINDNSSWPNAVVNAFLNTLDIPSSVTVPSIDGASTYNSGVSNGILEIQCTFSDVATFAQSVNYGNNLKTDYGYVSMDSITYYNNGLVIEFRFNLENYIITLNIYQYIDNGNSYPSNVQSTIDNYFNDKNFTDELPLLYYEGASYFATTVNDVLVIQVSFDEEGMDELAFAYFETCFSDFQDLSEGEGKDRQGIYLSQNMEYVVIMSYFEDNSIMIAVSIPEEE